MHAVSFPGWPAPHGLNEGDIAILLQLYDIFSVVARMLLASKTLPERKAGLCHGQASPSRVILVGWKFSYRRFNARGMNFSMLFRFGGGVSA